MKLRHFVLVASLLAMAEAAEEPPVFRIIAAARKLLLLFFAPLPLLTAADLKGARFW